MLSSKARSRLKKAPLFLVVAAIVATIGFLARQNHNHFENAMVRQAQGQLAIIARSEAQSIEKYIGDVDGELSNLASDPRLLDAFAGGDGTKEGYQELLKDSFREIDKLCDSLYLTDGKGIVISSVPLKASSVGADLSKAPDVKVMLSGQKPFTSGLFEGISGSKEIANLHPVVKNGKFIGILRAVIIVDRINKLIEHINSQQNVSAMVIDDDANILSSSSKENIGKNAMQLLGENPSNPDIFKMKEIVRKMNGGDSGSEVIRYMLGRSKKNSADMLVSYMPIRIGEENWSIAVGMAYGSIIGPINRNARDNLVFVVFILIILLIAGIIFYRSEKRSAELSISKTCLDLINKQLHIEIEKRKEIEKNLTECLRNRQSSDI